MIPTPPTKRSLFLVDDHPLVRESLQRLISSQTDLLVCGEAGGVAEAIDGIEHSHPDAAIIDLSLRQSSGLDLIKDLRARGHEVPVLVLSMHDEELYAERVLKAGGQGYISKQEGGPEILRAIRKLLDGELYLSESMSARLLRRAYSTPGEGKDVERLADRELEVFTMIGKGFNTRKIAESLSISPKTVETYRSRIKEKLGLQDAVELMQKAVQWVESYSSSQGTAPPRS